MADNKKENYNIKDSEIDISGKYSYYAYINKQININGKELVGGYFRLNGEKTILTSSQKYVGIFVDFCNHKKYYVDDQHNVFDFDGDIIKKVGQITKPKEVFNIKRIEYYHCGMFPVISQELLGYYVLGKRHNDITLGSSKDCFFDIKNDDYYFVSNTGHF